MNELRLQYQKETGIPIKNYLEFSEDWECLETLYTYIEWLERIIYPPSTKDMADAIALVIKNIHETH